MEFIRTASKALRSVLSIAAFALPGLLAIPVAAAEPATQPAANSYDDLIVAPVILDASDSDHRTDMGARAIPPLDASDSNHRIDMAARGPLMPRIFVIAPRQTGYTALASPTLYWFLSADTKDRIDVAAIEPGNPTPIFKLHLQGAKAGLHAVNLVKENTQLSPEKTYKLTASLTAEEGNQEETIYSAGFVRFEAHVALNPAPGAQDCAKAGLWYDTFDSICRAIEADRSNPHLRKQRESLLKSEGVLSASETSPDADGSQSDLFLILNSRSPTVDTQERQ